MNEERIAIMVTEGMTESECVHFLNTPEYLSSLKEWGERSAD